MKMQEQTYKASNIKAVIGLGNPGVKYYKTRHSIGFRVVDALLCFSGGSFQSSTDMEYAHVSFSHHAEVVTMYLIKPLTFMNDSGRILPWLTKKGIKPDEILVIHDELEKPFGYIGLKLDGSAKGHNGLRSIIGRIGSCFWRLRFGIGRPENKEDVGSFVLEPFNRQEEDRLEAIIAETVEKILT